MAYDRAITVFAPDGHLKQVEYAHEAARRGGSVVALKCTDGVVMVLKKKATVQLQVSHTHKKIHKLDDNVVMAFSGLNADARRLADHVRVECRNYRLNYDERPPIDYIAKCMSERKQLYTHKGGLRPYGVSSLIVGYVNNNAGVYYAEPSGIVTEWKAYAIGKNDKTLQEYLEINYKLTNVKTALGIGIKALLQVVEGGISSIEVISINDQGMKNYTRDDISQQVE